MSDQGWAGFLGNHRGEETPVERSSRLARQAAEQQDRRELADEAERTAALQERHELMELAALQAGMAGRTAGDVFADAMRLGDEDAEYSEAQRTIARIDKRRANRQRDMADQAQRMAEVTGLATRSAPTITGGEDLLAPAKAVHREFVQATRAAQTAAAAGAPRARRPKGEVSRSRGGEAIRSENCILCLEQGASDEEAFLLHNDPVTGIPVTTSREQASA